jgi:hypothetical protein
MYSPIAMPLSNLHDPTTLLDGPIAARGHSMADGQTFAELLTEGFRARAAQLGIDLPPESASSSGESKPAAAIDEWQQAKLRSIAAGNGPGDAMLKVLADAAAARYERRHQPPGAFDFMLGS